MKVKKLLAFTLAGTLTLSNIAWADISVPKTEFSQQDKKMSSAATASNADVEATPSNAMFGLTRACRRPVDCGRCDPDEIAFL